MVCPQIGTTRPTLITKPPVIWWWAASSKKGQYQRVGSLCRDGTDVQYMSAYKAKLYNSTTNTPKVSYSRLFFYLNPPKVAAHWYRHCLVSNVAGKVYKSYETCEDITPHVHSYINTPYYNIVFPHRHSEIVANCPGCHCCHFLSTWSGTLDCCRSGCVEPSKWK